MYPRVVAKIEKDGKICGIIIEKNKDELYFLNKRDFVNASNMHLSNASITLDGKVVSKEGYKIKKCKHSDFLEECKKRNISVKTMMGVNKEKLLRSSKFRKAPVYRGIIESRKMSFSYDKMVLYHGSSDIVKKPVYGFGKPYNDYGVGFYCTENYNLAGEWASKDGIGYINEYTLSLRGLNVLRLKSDTTEDILKWLALLIQNRTITSFGSLPIKAKKMLSDKYLIKNYRDYDVIIGYRADDSYFAYAKAFLTGEISLEKLCNCLFLGNLGYQVALISEKSFNNLEFSNFTRSTDIHTKLYRERDLAARRDYKDMKDDGNIYIIDILRREGYLHE